MKSTWSKKKAGQLKLPSLTAAFILLFVFLFILLFMPCVKPVAEAEIIHWKTKEANYSIFKPIDSLHKEIIFPSSVRSTVSPNFLDFSSSDNLSASPSTLLSADSTYFQEAHRQIRSKVQAILTSQRFRRTQFSISIRWAGTGDAIFEHQAHEPMIPASNMKLITSATALNLLGLDFEFKTVVGLIGQSLVIIGSGDPLLGDKEIDKRYGRQPNWLLEDIASRLAIKGIKSIQDIILDASIFDDQRVHPSWSDRKSVV